uniref:Alpha 1,4-glycosyltransferase domain-containing protein n=2 Tax=Emiliania huxleyi TaxID=2903 RepID=A0A7S3SED9_EMIHU
MWAEYVGASVFFARGWASDRYYSPQLGESAWEQHFEPPFGVTTGQVRVGRGCTLELSCSALKWLAFDWGGQQALSGPGRGIYPTQLGDTGATTHRLLCAAAASAFVRPRLPIRREASALWQDMTLGGHNSTGRPVVLGVHLRGTDKKASIGGRIVQPAEYFPWIDAFFAKHEPRAGRALLFLATDDQAFLAQVVQRYGDRVLLQPGVQRPANGTPIWMARAAIGTRTAEPVDEARRRGVQVLLDTLLLSRCDYLLKSSSAVSEFALYFAPRLIARTHDFSFEAGSPWGSPAGLPATNGRGGAPPWAWEPQPAKAMHLARGGRCALREPREAGGEGGEPFVVLGNGTVRGAAAGEDAETAAAAGEAAGKAAEKALDDGLTPEAAAAAGKAAGDAIIAGADIEIAPWTGEPSCASREKPRLCSWKARERWCGRLSKPPERQPLERGYAAAQLSRLRRFRFVSSEDGRTCARIVYGEALRLYRHLHPPSATYAPPREKFSRQPAFRSERRRQSVTVSCGRAGGVSRGGAPSGDSVSDAARQWFAAWRTRHAASGLFRPANESLWACESPMESPPTVPRRILQMGATAEAARSTLVQAWRRLNPEYDHVFLTDAEGGDFVRAIASTAERAAYGALATGAQRSDLLRLLWLRELGGIYADSDTEPTLPLRVFVPRRATFLRTGSTFEFIGTRTGHPLFRWAVANVTREVQRQVEGIRRGRPLCNTSHTCVIRVSGPVMYQRARRTFCRSKANVKYRSVCSPARKNSCSAWARARARWVNTSTFRAENERIGLSPEFVTYGKRPSPDALHVPKVRNLGGLVEICGGAVRHLDCRNARRAALLSPGANESILQRVGFARCETRHYSQHTHFFNV